jgi:hypothetical protein
VGLVVADLNGDSRDDILLSCRTDANAALYLGRAGGGLELAGTFAAGLLPSKPVLCDLDQDGVADVVFPQPGTKQFGIMVRAYRPPGPRCPADVDGDAFVDASDFVVLASYFGAPVPPGTLGDLNGDGVVNTADFVMLAADFGCTP